MMYCLDHIYTLIQAAYEPIKIFHVHVDCRSRINQEGCALTFRLNGVNGTVNNRNTI